MRDIQNNQFFFIPKKLENPMNVKQKNINRKLFPSKLEKQK